VKHKEMIGQNVRGSSCSWKVDDDSYF